jgi:hypothetical protein
MEITPVIIGAKISQFNIEKAINLLSKNQSVRFLWRTYGDQNFMLVAFCTKGKEGKIVQDIQGILEEFNAEHICVSIGFVWEKMNYSPFDDQVSIELKMTNMIENLF